MELLQLLSCTKIFPNKTGLVGFTYLKNKGRKGGAKISVSQNKQSFNREITHSQIQFSAWSSE